MLVAMFKQADTHGNLSTAQREPGKLGEALACYKCKLPPNDDGTRHHVGAWSDVTATGVPSKCTKGVFDNYATKFDQHLTQALSYNVTHGRADSAAWQPDQRQAPQAGFGWRRRTHWFSPV